MKRILYLSALVGTTALTASGCDQFLDVNENPNAPQTVTANLYLPQMLHSMASSALTDGLYVGRYNQEWILPASPPTSWDRMGYDAGLDRGGQLWRDVYYVLGQNLVDMMNKAEAEQRWDLLGVGYLLKAWGWQQVTDMHGELIIKEAYDQSKLTFTYDSQEFAYTEIQRLLGLAIENLKRTDGAVNQAYLGRTDRLYGGDRTKWLKFAYGLLALNLNHYSNKASYKPAEVIAAVDQSFASNADDALFLFPGTVNDDRNFMGWTRDNYRAYRQTQFVVGLMSGAQFTAVDPRMSRMLSPAPDGVYRGLDPQLGGVGALTPAQQPNNIFGYVGTTGGGPARYLFDDKSRMPIMTYSQLQFIKAEAAYRVGNSATALQAYINGISSHIDFVNARNLDAGQAPTQISAAEKAAFLASPTIVPPAANLTLTLIMSQKYIAQWSWAHVEIWTDLRRYGYTGLDPRGGQQVFPGFVTPTNLFPDNRGNVVQRMRPRYNSEYVWNQAGLRPIGGLETDFHTKPMWIIQP